MWIRVAKWLFRLRHRFTHQYWWRNVIFDRRCTVRPDAIQHVDSSFFVCARKLSICHHFQRRQHRRVFNSGAPESNSCDEQKDSKQYKKDANHIYCGAIGGKDDRGNHLFILSRHSRPCLTLDPDLVRLGEKLTNFSANSSDFDKETVVSLIAHNFRMPISRICIFEPRLNDFLLVSRIQNV